MSGEVAYAEDRFRNRGGFGRVPRHAPTERQRFEQILARHHRRLRGAVAGMLADRDGVDDVLQDAYLKAYRHLPRHFESVEREAAWLYRIVYRTALDELRRRRRRPERSTRDIELVAMRDRHALQFQHEESEILALEDAFRTLPVRDRALLMLVGVLRLDQETAARILGIPRSTLAWRLRELRTLLQEVIEP
jgi:RNA polymerase sigma factor (sigma-70 family)